MISPAFFHRRGSLRWGPPNFMGSRLRQTRPLRFAAQLSLSTAALPVGAADVGATQDAGSLLGRKVLSPGLRGAVFETELDLRALPYLADHRITGRTLAPMTAFLEMVQQAVWRMNGERRVLADVTFTTPLVLSEDKPCTVQIVIEDGEFRIFSLRDEAWTLPCSQEALSVAQAQIRVGRICRSEIARARSFLRAAGPRRARIRAGVPHRQGNAHRAWRGVRVGPRACRIPSGGTR